MFLIYRDAYLMTKGIDLNQAPDAPGMDSLAKRCINTAFDALQAPHSSFTGTQQAHLAHILKSMAPTHQAIRELLRHERARVSVDAAPLARIQLETLFSICLILDQTTYIDVYLKHSWKEIYIRHLLMSAECRDLPNVMAELDKQVVALENLRKLAGVTDAERATIRQEHLNEPLPPGMSEARIEQFPTPGRALRLIRDPARKKMLSRLYFEYQSLCSFVHFTSHGRTFKGIFDEREPFRRLFSTTELESMFQKEIAGPAIWIDFLSIVQSAAEMVVLYPGDIELRRAVTDAWAVLSERTIIGRAVWDFRTKKLLGII